jgi:PTH1 family peptidyl-tRNA hydrolase
MKIIVGLGNPGKEYAETRHNVGFGVIDSLREKLEFDDFKMKNKFDAFITEGEYKDEKIILVKPVTYMNLSGKSVAKVAKFYKVIFTDVFVVFDDLDFDTGTLKIREHGGPGTHNGMKSIVESTGSQNFPRLRIGIGKADGKKANVLGKFNKKELRQVLEVIDLASDAIIYSFENGIPNTMNKYNTK